MNNDRRKSIRALIEQAEKLAEAISELHGAIDEVLSEEQDYFDNMPEGIQGGDKGNLAQEAVDALQEAIDTLDSWDVSEVTSALDRATEG